MIERPCLTRSLGVLFAVCCTVSVAFSQKPTPSPSATPSATPTSSLPWVVPTPVPLPTLAPMPAMTPLPSPTTSVTPLPDGTMPLPLPPVPALSPAPDASTLSDQLNLPIPAPTQSAEKLLPTAEDQKLKQSESDAMKQKMIMADFDNQLSALIAKQRNRNVADMSLDEAVRTAVKQNPNVLNAIQQIRLTRGQLIQVVSQVIPHAIISSSYSQQALPLASNGRSSGDGSLEIPIPGSPPLVLNFAGNNEVQNQQWNIQFQAQQLLFDGGTSINSIRANSAAYDSAYFALRATVDNIIAQVKTLFYQVVLNRALIVAQEQNVALLQQQVQDQQNRYDAGTVPRFNVLQAEVQLANAKPPLIQAQNNYRVSLYQLVQLLGMDYPAGSPSEVPFNVLGGLGYVPRTIDTDASIRTAISRNPALKAQRQDILAQARNMDAQMGGYLPTINANVGYEFTNNIGNMNLTDTVEGWFFGATGSWNVFDGGLTYGRVAQAKAQLMQTKNNYDNSVRQVILNVQTAISNLQQARETIDATTASVVQATEALRLSRERLDAGAGTQLDVLNAQVQLLQAQTFVLQARYDYIAAMASYDQALSLDTNYAETFDDPMSRAERAKYKKLNNPARPQPKLPGKLRKEDPIKPILDPPTTKQKPEKKKAGIVR